MTAVTDWPYSQCELCVQFCNVHRQIYRTSISHLQLNAEMCKLGMFSSYISVRSEISETVSGKLSHSKWLNQSIHANQSFDSAFRWCSILNFWFKSFWCARSWNKQTNKKFEMDFSQCSWWQRVQSVLVVMHAIKTYGAFAWRAQLKYIRDFWCDFVHTIPFHTSVVGNYC